ncbi:hypothetical protein IVB18_25670 [Bradyrhizobium sp. 186]|uniref:hypothetical protein n=1 Tax=Bradyrhizobium sp. 186 TaxID=2782654 RepID=UPI002000BA4D|nr:hypothetical protein [Bradyrhizobium sp. 186]UPK31730.1 hypothetical protein IVB18_25670 [Bradyrhizobium sp. 186]
MARRGDRLLVAAAALFLGISGAAAEDARVNTIQEIFQHLRTCWKPPPAARARPIDITVVVSFNRAGNILGHPRITYESAEASDDDRLQYRIAVMEALQRCTPMPFTDAMAGAAAGRPFAIQFRNRKTSPPTEERRT